MEKETLKNFIITYSKSKKPSPKITVEQCDAEIKELLKNRINEIYELVNLNNKNLYCSCLKLISILHFNQNIILKDSPNMETYLEKIISHVDSIIYYFETNGFVIPFGESEILKNNIISIVKKYNNNDILDQILKLVDEL